MAPDDMMSNSAMAQFKPGELLFRENDAGQFFYVIQEGQIEIYKTRGQTKVPLAILTTGQCVGEFAALDGKRRSATAMALTPVKVLRIGADALDAQIHKNPAWFQTITFSLVERLRQTNDILRRNSIVDEELSSMISKIQATAKSSTRNFDEAIEDLKGAIAAASSGKKAG